MIRGIASFAGLLFLLFIIATAFISRLGPASLEERGAKFWLSLPVMLVQTAFFVIIGLVLWHPIPLGPDEEQRRILLGAGALPYFGGLALYLWGLWVLGRGFGASSVFGVRLRTQPRLVTSGPFRFLRHPLYAGLILASFGGMLIFLTWSMVAAAVFAPALVLRARREERVLARQFGDEWARYASVTPAWLPRF